MIHQDEIIQIVQTIWTSILNLPIEVIPPEDTASEPLPGRSFTACVQFTGDFEGATLLHCSSRLALELTSIMFAEKPEQLSIEDLQDALGELTNMIAGNIKPLLPGHSRLSLPSVVDGREYQIKVPGSRPLQRQRFRCLGEILDLSLQIRSTS